MLDVVTELRTYLPLYAEGKRGREQTHLAGRRYQGRKAYRRKTLRAAALHGVAMLLRVLPIVISMMGMLATSAWAETLPLPSSLRDADLDVGERLFLESDATQAYFPLAANFLTQKYQSYCGVASIVMVLNALQLPAPAVPEFAPYRTFTQDNVLDERIDAVLPRHVLLNKGMTLDQLGGLLALQLLNVEVRHAGDATLDEFRAEARVSRTKRSFRDHQLSEDGYWTGAWRAHLAVGDLRCPDRSLPNS